MAQLFRRVAVHAPKAGSMLVIVLLASIAVASVLAYHAITAARQRRAVSEAMLRQYAQLALWEFSRQARRDLEDGLMHALGSYAHPQRPNAGAASTCDCGLLDDVEQWFEVRPGGDVRVRSGELDARFRDRIARLGVDTARGGSESALKIALMPDDPMRFVAMKWEPHLGADGGQVGLIARAGSLGPLLARSYQRSSLLPAALVGSGDARTLVHLRVLDRTGQSVFASQNGAPGPYREESAFLPNLPLALTAQTSMTPEFIATLGPEHGSGPSSAFVIALVAVNVLLVGVGLWQLQRERELARLRSEFIAGVSHELRTPLAQIRMFSETLLLERTRNLSERHRALEIIGQESQRLSQLVDNVLHFHRHRGPSAPSGNALVDLPVFAREVVDSFQPLTTSKRVRVVFAAETEQVMVRADAGALRQVLLNLLDNAVKFGPAGQTITVRVQVRGADAILIVEDQGPGVPVSDRERIFRPFERGLETRGTGGAGIGLAVVAQVVSAHGGAVLVDEGPGSGARFTVVLRAAEDAGRLQAEKRLAG
jgi:signal transduction histidine kinase